MIYQFTSLEFILFFILVFCIYWLLPKKFKNTFLLLASYVFYASWNYKFLLLIFTSTMVNYLCGIRIHNSKNIHSRKAFLVLALAANLLLLAFFKYSNFFIESFGKLLMYFGIGASPTVLNIILPLGISFYTFEVISYIVDIYRNEFVPTENIIEFALFVAYFPKLISGPIERARNIIPKIQDEKHFNNINFKENIYLFSYGLFKKIVIANSLAPLVNNTFSLANPTGTQILIAAYAFAIQIYCDFSGYVDIARAISGFFGINLIMNFNLPYLSKNPSDFWSRWNITLSYWVRDYVYIPLGGMYSALLGIFPLLISWILMGLWHGAAFNFIIWGVYWFAITILYHFIRHAAKLIKDWTLWFDIDILKIILMFHVTTYGWIIFRSERFSQIVVFTKSLFSGINLAGIFNINYLYLWWIIIFLMVYEAMQYYKNDTLFICKKGFYYQLVFYIAIFIMYINIEPVSNPIFLYFQF